MNTEELYLSAPEPETYMCDHGHISHSVFALDFWDYGENVGHIETCIYCVKEAFDSLPKLTTQHVQNTPQPGVGL